MLLLYSHTVTPRLQYIVDFFSKELLEGPVTITDDPDAFRRAEGPKLNYSGERTDSPELYIRPVSLLFETGIRSRPVDCFIHETYTVFFGTEGDIPFDILAASFYLLSRYEEYLPHEKDMYGRYAHTNALAFKEGFLHLPLVNIWMEAFRKVLANRFPSLQFRYPQFKCVLTYDIDMAYSYKHKGLIRTTGGFVRDFLKGQWSLVRERWQVLRGHLRDPFDCFEWLDALHLYCRLTPYYFFLVAKRQMGYDKNISTRVKVFRDLIEYYAGTYKIGLHPSWQSGDDEKLLKEELEWLEVVADKQIAYSRQHYIRFSLPHTFRLLTDAGIQKDFSMGYGTINGFRASVCSSFHWYDLEREVTSPLVLYPFCFMDANSYYEQKDTPQEAYRELIQYYDRVKSVKGMMISIWHNSTLGTASEFREWRQVFELFMRETVYWDAYYD